MATSAASTLQLQQGQIKNTRVVRPLVFHVVWPQDYLRNKSGQGRPVFEARNNFSNGCINVVSRLPTHSACTRALIRTSAHILLSVTLLKSFPASPAFLKLSCITLEPISPSAMKKAPKAMNTSTTIVSHILLATNHKWAGHKRALKSR